MTSLARLAQAAEQAKWPYPRDEMIEPGLIVLRMIDDLDALALQDAPMTQGALVEMGWPEDVARHFFPRAHESATISQSIATLLRSDPPRAAPLIAPPAANDDDAFAYLLALDRMIRRELRVFIAGASAGMVASLMLLIAFAAIAKGLPK